MKIERLLIVFLAAAVALASCKKDDDEASMTFGGSLAFDVPEYLAQNQTLTFTPGKISRSSDDKDLPEVNMYYKFTLGDQTDSIFNIDLSKQYKFSTIISAGAIGRYTLSVYAYAEHYSMSYYSTNIVVVDPVLNGRSLNGLDIDKDTPSFTDADGTKYYTVEICGKTWMKQNYAGSGYGVPYKSSPVLNAFVGKYYSWDEAQKACPEGWHLSTPEEWHELAKAYSSDPECPMDGDYQGMAGKLMVNARLNGESLWEYWPGVTITNASGLSALPAGYANRSNVLRNKDFVDLGRYAAFWTSGEHGDSGDYRYIISDEYDDVKQGMADKDNFLASVRCVKD